MRFPSIRTVASELRDISANLEACIDPYALTCALHGTSDGIKAKELILSLVGMAPDARGGEGDDYYADYTSEQIAWANEHWEALGMERETRYCNPEDGSVRSLAKSTSRARVIRSLATLDARRTALIAPTAYAATM